MKTLFDKIVERRLQNTVYFDTRQDAEFKYFIALNVPTSQHVHRLISHFTMRISIAQPKQKTSKVSFSS